MIQRFRICVSILLLTHTVSACAGSLKTITVHVNEESGNPVEEALVRGRFFQDQVIQNEKRVAHQSLTDEKGVAVISGEEDIYVDMNITKDGYYESEKRVVVRSADKFDVSVLLREKRNPIAMYAKDVLLSARSPRKSGKQFGYDLMAGDFIQPYGNGAVSDFLITHTYRKQDPFNYEFKIVVEFSNPRDGILPFYPVSNSSEYISVYTAPDSGYKSDWRIEETRSGEDIQSTKDRRRNYYFRVRTKLTDEGEIESAHYGKIYGEFPDVTYYINPTPNDRNIEFDPKRNMFNDLDPDERVLEP